MRATTLASPRLLARFHLEVQAAARLDHANIVPVYESGERDGLPWFSMKLVAGKSLAQRTGAGEMGLAGVSGAAPESARRGAEIAALVSAIARAVHYAHEHGVLHRDLKLSNILVEKDGTPYLLQGSGKSHLLERFLTFWVWQYLRNRVESQEKDQPMSTNLNRRKFLQKSAVASSAAALTFRFEDQALLAQPSQSTLASAAAQPARSFPQGKLGKLSVSRLICGGNLISGFAHSRDLIYVSSLLKQYFTDEKVFETLAVCEAHGVNTAILRLDDDTIRILGNYRKQRGSKIQWIAQVQIKEDDLTPLQRAIDHGAAAAYVHGGVGDSMVEQGKVEVLGKAIELVKKNGAVAGIAGHSIEVVKACERAKLSPDFYMKTFNSKRYWSAGPTPRHDSVWEETPEETKSLMEEVDRPWIAYKVLGAGAIHPREGFQYAYQSGADFLCVGMFDFQVAEDVELAQLALEKSRSRSRPWCA